MLGALALGAQRLLPLLQQTYSAYSSIKGSYSSFIDTLKFLKSPSVNCKDEANRATVSFKNSIHIKNLNFQYGSDSPIVLKGVDLTLKKGSCIGIMGKTGSGKSTLLDIIMGLLIVEEGSFFVDDTPITSNNIQHWRSHISHVPQVIYLADDTIEGNIAFGVPKDQIDYDRVRHAANQAQISEFIEGLSGKYKAFVGECGVRLSGGQRQRIGIARALYKKSDVIVFDEATSALDSETELQVMKSIEEFGEGNTIIVIAHRLSTLKNCDQIIELSEGGILQIGTYKDVVY
jgi:ATP-binding cassette subfamily B protein